MIDHVELIYRLLLGAALGSAVGFERERHNRVAGLRTHMLVCVGSTLVMLVSQFGFADVLKRPDIVLDPSRIAAQVVSGIGFLGAGAILLRGDTVRGLTTAASLWAVAAIGLAVGGGLCLLAVSATAIILLILAGIKPLESSGFFNRRQPLLELLAERGAVEIGCVEAALDPGAVRVERCTVQPSGDPGIDRVTLLLSRASAQQIDTALHRLRDLHGVRECYRVCPA